MKMYKLIGPNGLFYSNLAFGKYFAKVLINIFGLYISVGYCISVFLDCKSVK